MDNLDKIKIYCTCGRHFEMPRATRCSRCHIRYILGKVTRMEDLPWASEQLQKLVCKENDNEDLKEMQADYKDILERFDLAENALDSLKDAMHDYNYNWIEIYGEE